MNELIAITTQGGKQTVNARDLHTFLEVGKDFSTWIKDRIQQFDFIEGQDFKKSENLSSPISGNSKARLQTVKEYTLTISMAKELSMVERNEKGKQARQYFIACEQALKEVATPKSFSEALRLAAAQQEIIEEKERQLALAAPKVEFYDTVVGSETVCQLAVACQVANLPFGRNTLFKKLRECNALITEGERRNLPYQSMIDKNLFTVKERHYENPKTGDPMISYTTRVTQAGIAWLIEKFGGKQ
jgi:anti-repressor protein